MEILMPVETPLSTLRSSEVLFVKSWITTINLSLKFQGCRQQSS